ncbi:MAG: putative 2-aminoethylphosphonate ABC transporter substrate-binding protein [Clostridiales Family XIII bacterium]|jgi:iron(III) transport system substrate-binding protein|nr:putative 2-aminoethylphosphonate ABC transporter substrate-binding protein [Clostridiales Family XIII bacterium]
MKLRKYVSVCIAALIPILAVTALSACTSSGAGEPPGADSAAAAETDANRDETGSKSTNGEITVYTALEDEQVTEYLAVFNTEYPDIEVNVVRESTGVITARLLAEKDNPQADAVWGTAASSMMILDDEGMLEAYAPEGVGRILPDFKSNKPVPTWVGIDAWETAFIVNTAELKKLGLSVSDIKSYDDLLNPALKNHIVMSNPNSSGTGFLTVAGVIQLRGKDTDAGWDYLTKLHENVDQYVHSGSKPAKMAAAGECVVGVSFGYAGISRKADGAPVEVIFPEEGSGWDMEANALMKKDSINTAALTFLDWAISDPAMDLYKANYPIIATGGDGNYEGYESNPVDQLIDNDFNWVAQNRNDILNEWIVKYDSKSEAQ